MMSETINIIYASDDNFSEIMGISIVSLFESNSDIDNMNIYIVDNGITENNKVKIEMIFESYNRIKPIWLHAININFELGVEVKQDRGSLSQFSRLFISRMLPDTVEKILYLDCDVIIEKSIKELWETNLEGNIIGAISDAFSKLYRRNLKIEDDDLLINSGVMLIDMVKWNENRVEEKILSFIKNHNGLIPQGDQGVLGAILTKDTYILNPKFNSLTLFYDFSYKELIAYRKPMRFYNQETITTSLEEPVIVHFTTSFSSERPWVEGSKHPYTQKWLEYKMISPWANYELKKSSKSQMTKIYLGLFNKLPRKISIGLSGILQAYGRPLIEKIKYKL